MIAVGQTVADYRLLRVLGEGGMGIVYEAEKISLGARVALKVLSDSIADDPLAIERFQQEAKAAAALNHPNVVKVFDFGVHEGRCFYAMQLVNGLSLSDLIRHRRGEPRNPGPTAEYAGNEPPQTSPSPANQALIDSAKPSGTARSGRARLAPPADPATLDQVAQHYVEDPYAFAAQVGLQAARGLAEAHRHDLVHRDVKPSNLMIDRHGQTYVIDFGLVRSMSKTRSEFRRGTLRYMSPEQLDLRELDGRTDVYSLGASLYQLVSGQPPFDGETESAVASKIRAGRFRPLSDAAPHCPAELARIIEKALRYNREQRFASAQAMADALQRISTATDSAPQTAAPRRDESSTVAFDLPSPRRWRKVAGTAVCLGIGLLLFSGFSADGTQQNSQASNDQSEVAVEYDDELTRSVPISLYPFERRRVAEKSQTVLDRPELVLGSRQVEIRAEGGSGLGAQVAGPSTRCLLRLGQTRAQRYRLSVEVSSVHSHWPLGRIQEVGLYYGGRWCERVDGSKFYRATTLGTLWIPGQPNPASGAEEYVLQAAVTQTDEQGAAVANNELGYVGASGYLGPRDGESHRIEVQIGQGVIEAVSWDGKPLASVSSFNKQRGLVTDEDFVGEFGITTLGCDAVFHKPTITILPDDE